MENNGSTSSCRLRPPVHPYARTTTGVPQASNSHHQPYSRRLPFQREPAAAVAHFSCQAAAYQLPLSPATHVSAGGASASLGLDGSISMDIVSESGSTATFHSSLNTGLPASSSFVGFQAAASSLSTPPPVCQLPPLPPSLGGPVDPVYQPYSTSNTGPNLLGAPCPTFGVKNTISYGGSSSAWTPQPPFSSGVNTGPMVSGSKQNMPSSPRTTWGSGAPGSSIQYKDDPNAPLVPTFVDGLFTHIDIDKINQDKDLKDIVLINPKKVRSILGKRRAEAAYLSDLEHKFELLQKEKKSLSHLVNSQQSTIFGLTAERNEMMIKIDGFEQRIQLMNALNKTLYAQVCRL